jgi:hypothetical protein
MLLFDHCRSIGPAGQRVFDDRLPLKLFSPRRQLMVHRNMGRQILSRCERGSEQSHSRYRAEHARIRRTPLFVSKLTHGPASLKNNVE